MLLEEFGVLSTAHDITTGATRISENVILVPSLPDLGWGEVWLSVITETIATGDASDTFEFVLVLGDQVGLDGTNKEVCGVTITDFEDSRIAVADRNILDFEVGQMIGEIADSTYKYLGLTSVISAGSTISINAALSPSKPRSKDNVQVVRSNVGVPT